MHSLSCSSCRPSVLSNCYECIQLTCFVSQLIQYTMFFCGLQISFFFLRLHSEPGLGFASILIVGLLNNVAHSLKFQLHFCFLPIIIKLRSRISTLTLEGTILIIDRYRFVWNKYKKRTIPVRQGMTSLGPSLRQLGKPIIGTHNLKVCNCEQ